LPEEWEEPIIVPIYKKGDKTDCSDYKGISFSQIRTQFMQNSAVKVKTPYTEEITEDRQCGFRRRNRPTTEHSAVKVNSICRGSYWGSSVWIPTQQTYY